jgi:hypothetical protein
LLVVIDDIDRLTTDEILQIFQLVKANADFPQLIYLLLFERQIVAKALNQISGDKGMEFLEKIIQVGYHVPQASRGAVQRVLLTGLDQHLEKTPASKYWNKHRWSDLYVEGISGYFKNLRHVYRFLASFTFHMQHHRSGNSIEVNPMDLIGLETLRVFEPGVYERLSGAKAILTRYEGKGFFGEIKQEVVNQAVSEIVSASPLENQSKVREILNALFPPISPEFAGKDAVTPHHQEWLRELRVCHPDLFDKYFTLTIADEDISQAELDRFVALTSDATKFQTACEALKKRGLLNLAFERLDAYKAQIPLEAMPSLILALCNMSDSFPERGGKSFGQMFEHDLSAYAWRLCYFGLKREPDAKRRYQILHDVVSRSSGLALPFELVSLDDRVGDREARGYDFLLDQGDVKALKTVCVQKFRVALKIKNPSVRQSQQFRVILLRWSSWESTDEVKCLVHDQIRTPKDALWLLTVLLGESHSYGRDHRVCYSITLGLLERFTDIAHLTQLVAKLGLNSLSKRETIALREFDKALKRRAEGKPDIVGDASHDPDEEVVE